MFLVNSNLGDLMKIEIFPDADAVARKGAEIIAAEARAVVKARGRFIVFRTRPGRDSIPI